MENSKYYFAYGSNLNHEQMAVRCPDSVLIGTSYIENYALQFKRFANIIPQKNSNTPVAIWKISREDEAKLDLYEGVPNSYVKQNFTVNLNDQNIIGHAYIISRLQSVEAPQKDYLTKIQRGYIQNNLPIEILENAVHQAEITEYKALKTYIAYGANLSQKDMKIRCPDAKILYSGNITNYSLEFKGCATIEPNKGENVPVLVWEISRQDERNLDRFEGFPSFYRKEYFHINNTLAMAYIMNGNRELSLPSNAYFNTIKHGYKEAGLDESKLNEAVVRAAIAEENRFEQKDLFSDFGEIKMN